MGLVRRMAWGGVAGLAVAVGAIACAAGWAGAGHGQGARTGDVESVDAILGALYDVISGSAGEERDWERFRSLLAPGARLIPVARLPGTAARARVLTAEEFVEAAREATKASGFFEREVARKVESFGAIAHVWSTYESRHAEGEEPFARGINSIQLLNDGSRWWVVTIYWDAERPDNPIPREYLPKE